MHNWIMAVCLKPIWHRINKLISVVQLPSHVRLCDPMDCSTPGSLSLAISQSLPEFTFIASVRPSSHLILWCPLLLLPLMLPSIRDFAMSCLFASYDQNTGASTSASVLPVNIQVWSPLRLVWSPCSPRNFQESSQAPEFEGISSLAFCLLYGSSIPIKVNYLYFKKRAEVRIATFLSLSLPPWLWKLLPKGTLHVTHAGYTVSAEINLYFVEVKKKTNIFCIYLIQFKGKSRLSSGNVSQPQACLPLYCVFSMYTSLNTNLGPAQRRRETSKMERQLYDKEN